MQIEVSRAKYDIKIIKLLLIITIHYFRNILDKAIPGGGHILSPLNLESLLKINMRVYPSSAVTESFFISFFPLMV